MRSAAYPLLGTNEPNNKGSMMEDRIVIYENDKGQLVRLIYAEKSRWSFEEMIEKDVPEGADYSIIQRSDIPKDKTFVDAWKKSGDKIEVDMTKARDIHMNRILEARNKETERAKRQALRNIPQDFTLDSANTVEDLEAIWPDGLPRNS